LSFWGVGHLSSEVDLLFLERCPSIGIGVFTHIDTCCLFVCFLLCSVFLEMSLAYAPPGASGAYQALPPGSASQPNVQMSAYYQQQPLQHPQQQQPDAGGSLLSLVGNIASAAASALTAVINSSTQPNAGGPRSGFAVVDNRPLTPPEKWQRLLEHWQKSPPPRPEFGSVRIAGKEKRRVAFWLVTLCASTSFQTKVSSHMLMLSIHVL
jgi:hypothetical protein